MSLPLHVRPLWEGLEHEVTSIHWHWIVYRQLFGESRKRVELLNQCASEFFYIVQNVLLNDVQLSLSRLADHGNTNATLQTLLQMIIPLNKSQLNSDLKQHIENFRGCCQQIRKRRNKKLAHSDLETFLSGFDRGRATPIEGPSRTEIEAALSVLRDFMNLINVEFFGSETAYEHFISIHDGESLLQVLSRGLRYGQLVTDGAISLEDLQDRGFRDD